MSQPLVSVIIRTCQRPQLLRIALDSLKAQTYSNIEVVVVEDGAGVSATLLKNEYSNLNYIYEATGVKIGRARAGNRALELATGTYINFLDDDDAFFPEHVAVLAEALDGEKRLAAYCVAKECQIIEQKNAAFPYKYKRKTVRYRQEFNRLLLYAFNYIPIQSMMFHRSLYETLGGFDEHLDKLEDWDLWVRYSTKTDFKFVDKVTSYYHVPYKNKEKSHRKESLNEYLGSIYEKFGTYSVDMNVAVINKETAYVIREYKNKGFLRYLRLFFRAVLLGER